MLEMIFPSATRLYKPLMHLFRFHFPTILHLFYFYFQICWIRYFRASRIQTSYDLSGIRILTLFSTTVPYQWRNIMEIFYNFLRIRIFSLFSTTLLYQMMEQL